jgi:hypothetical protein
MRLLLCTLAVLLALPAVATAAKRDVNVQLLSLRRARSTCSSPATRTSRTTA